MPSGTTCPGAVLPVRTHMPMPTPGSQCHPLGQRSADQQRAANWADGNSTKRAPATGMDGRRFPTTGCQRVRVVTFAVDENPEVNRLTMVAWGGPIAAMRADTSCILPSLPPSIFEFELCKCNSVLETGSAVRWRICRHRRSLAVSVFPRPGDRVQNDSPVVVDQQLQFIIRVHVVVRPEFASCVQAVAVK
jgi:hypothetical protein